MNKTIKLIPNKASSFKMLTNINVICKVILIFLFFLTAHDNVCARDKTDGQKSLGVINITSKMSLIHVGSNDSFIPTSEGVEAGRLLLDSLENKNKESAAKAIEIYKKIVPRENYGGEYTALQWFAEYLISTDKEKENYFKDAFVEDFFHFYADNNFALLKEYLKRKYKLSTIGDEEKMEGHNRLVWLEDTILFNNPRREEWENTNEFLKIIKLSKGSVIADVGAGPGYYSVKFSKIVGDKGTVFSIDTVEKHLDYLERLKKKFKLNNIKTVHTDGKSLGISGEKVDAVFMCSLYHNIYGMSTLPEREQLIESIKDALKDDGRLYLFDNGLVPPGVLPYHGPYVAKELVIAQLNYYGLQLVEQHQPVPQRYALVFQKINHQPGE
jgi:SAM-dependent methyltransferase